MTKLWWVLLLAMGLLTSPVAKADEDYDKLVGEYEDAKQKYIERAEKIWAEYQAKQKGDKAEPFDRAVYGAHPAIEFMPRFRQAAEKHAGKPEAISYLGWIICSTRFLPDQLVGMPPDAEYAFDQLASVHAAQPEVKEALRDLWANRGGFRTVDKQRLCIPIVIQNKDKEALGWARLNLGDVAYGNVMFARFDVDSRKSADKEAHEYLEKVVSDHASDELVEAAERILFDLDRLQIGMVAPDIVGTDADGKEIKLSQFRGQVVVLDFWGFW